MFLMLLVLLGVACVVATLSMERSQKRTVIATGTLLVTGTDSVIIDENLSNVKGLLKRPHRHIIVKFNDVDPGPAPCTSGSPDSVTWSLFYKHSHDEKSRCKNCLKLKLSWSVASSRTISWQIFGDQACLRS